VVGFLKKSKGLAGILPIIMRKEHLPKKNMGKHEKSLKKVLAKWKYRCYNDRRTFFERSEKT